MRWLLGLTTVGIAVGAAWAWQVGEVGLGGLLVRVAAVLAAVWLAYPAMVRLDRRTGWLLALGVVLVLLRPRAAIVVLPVIAWFSRTTKER